MLSPVPRWTDFPGILSLRSSIPRDSCNTRAYHWDNSRDELLGRWVCTKQECWRGMGRYWEKEYFLLKRKKLDCSVFVFSLTKAWHWQNDPWASWGSDFEEIQGTPMDQLEIICLQHPNNLGLNQQWHIFLLQQEVQNQAIWSSYGLQWTSRDPGFFLVVRVYFKAGTPQVEGRDSNMASHWPETPHRKVSLNSWPDLCLILCLFVGLFVEFLK